MLLFIHESIFWREGRIVVSIHLMLLFISAGDCGICYGVAFQYISCYSLSSDINSNARRKNQFQYISCYSLSRRSQAGCDAVRDVSIHLMLLFITFRSSRLAVSNGVSIHLMLLFIEALETEFGKMKSFNTSHVTLYQNSPYNSLRRSLVSIHLMLLFIAFPFSPSSR